MGQQEHSTGDGSGEPVTSLAAVGAQGELRTAIATGELVLHYQPIVDLTTGHATGVEALVRWRHPERGLLPPNDFLPALEHAPVIIELTRWVLRTACAAAATWPDWTIAVNISARDLVGSTLIDSVSDALAAASLPATRLVLEVTETAVVQDLPHAARTLGTLREQGISIDLDDFGTGYSSLLYLRDLPVTGVKIDREFISGIDREADNRAIVSSLLTLADTIGLSAIAEGVETPEQCALLSSLGCPLAQGYWWSRPQPAPAIDDIYLNGLGMPVPRATRSAPERTAPRDHRAHKQAMAMVSEGASLNTIAAALNAAGARTSKGTRWHPATVARLITSKP